MKVGVFTAITDESIGPVEIGTAAETAGFESLFIADHSHVPVRRETAYPYSEDGTLGRSNYRPMDPFVALSAAAAVTSRMRLGTGVALVAQRDPIVLAKEVATLDVISGGRFELGVGSGWLREEMRNHGTDPRLRVAILGERVHAMKAIWTQEEAEFHGAHVNFDPIFSWPKPVQHPHPPILVGGWGPSTFERIIDYGDAWMAPVGLEVGRLETGMAELSALARAKGHGRIPVTATVLPVAGLDLAPYRDLGVDRVLVAIGSGDRTTTYQELEMWSPLVRSWS